MPSNNRTPKPRTPEGRMGVYTALSDVPDRYRLRNHAAAYEGRDVWTEFHEYEHDEQGYDSDRHAETMERVGRYWKEHMADRGRHHALAMPEDVETFIAGLLDRMRLHRAYKPYWVRIEAFYNWLQWHSDHPHRYHPVLMAAAAYPFAGEVWEHKVSHP